MNDIIEGNALDELKKLPSNAYDCCVTSPPYWNQREYGEYSLTWDGKPGCEHEWKEIDILRKATPGDIPGPNSKIASRRPIEANRPGKPSETCAKCGAWHGELGLEPTPELYVKHLCDIFDEIKRVLKPGGVFWLNIGDKFNNSGGAGSQNSKYRRMEHHTQFSSIVENTGLSFPSRLKNFPARGIIGIPFRVAVALIDRGWSLIQTCIWWKRACTPESVVDRFTIDFEYVFFLAKTTKSMCYVNRVTGRSQKEKPPGSKGIEGIDWHKSRSPRGIDTKVTNWRNYQYFFNQQLDNYDARNKRAVLQIDEEYTIVSTRWLNEIENKISESPISSGSVIEIPTSRLEEPHFASFSPELVKLLLNAGCPAAVCAKCGVPRISFGVKKEDGLYKKILSDCGCSSGWNKPNVIDPFLGSGTTAVVAKELGFKWTGIEISPVYIDIAKKRLNIKKKTLSRFC